MNYTLRIILSSLGSITQLPDSQKIFGALVYLLSEEKGDAFASDFVEKVLNRKVNFMMSNLYPLDYISAPKSYLLNKLSDSSVVVTKELYKKIKSMDFIAVKHLIKYLTGNPEELERINFLQGKSFYQIRVGLSESVDFENRLFSVSKFWFGTEKLEQDYVFYMSFVEMDEYGFIEELVRNAEKQNIRLVLGPRASQGSNIYKVKRVERWKLPESFEGKYLNLGMLLPYQLDLFDLKESSLETFTSERRPYEGITSQHNNYISFIKDGSVISVKDKSRPVFLGKSIKANTDDHRIIYGNSFLYPLEVS